MKGKQIVIICNLQTYLNLKNICPSVNISKTIKGEINAILINNCSVKNDTSQNIDSLESVLEISIFKDLGYSKNNNSQVILYL